MSSEIIKQGMGFAVFPSVNLYNYKADSKTKTKKIKFLKQLIYGDYIKPDIVNDNFVEVTEKGKIYIKVRARNSNGYILSTDIQAERILEVNFVDVGQGDGCHIVTPDDKHFIIDAGGSDNMSRFLNWRFNLKYSNTPPPPFTAIITHSDVDHYRGFGKLFAKKAGFKNQFTFTTVYHNGLVETSGSKLDSLGKVTPDGQHITNLIRTDGQFKNLVKSLPKTGNYINTLNKTTAPKKSLHFGHSPIYKKGNMKIEVMAPYTKKINGKYALPAFLKNKSKTKNGNSVVLRISIGKLKILLGGDLNSPAEDYLLSCYSKMDVAGIKNKLSDTNLSNADRQNLEKQLSKAIEKTNKHVGADIAKSCHHGSSDFTTEFLKAVNPIATVISSGDEEPYCHPRPDTLGTIGKYSRGERSLIFSTELARSSKEFIELNKSNAKDKKIRTITNYGMINVRTDGEKVIIAQKLERRTAYRDWDIHIIEWNNLTSQFEFLQ